MLKMALCAFMILGNMATAGPFFSEANQLEIRKYRFSRHSHKGFERLVLEFDHLGGKGTKPNVKVEMGKNDASITLFQAKLSGIIPESEINHSFLTKSRFLGPVAISAQKESFQVATSFKKNATIEAFWLEQPARLVMDVFPQAKPETAAAPPRRGLAQTVKTPFVSAHNEVFCFPANAQLQASVAFGRRTRSIGGLQSEAVSDELTQDVVCFPKQARLTPQITFTAAPYPVPQSHHSSSPITTDPVGGSQKESAVETPIEPTAAVHPAPLMNEAAAVDPMLMQPGLIPPASTIAAVPTAPFAAPFLPDANRIPTSVIPSPDTHAPGTGESLVMPEGTALIPPTLPTTPADVVNAENPPVTAAAEAATEAAETKEPGGFPKKKKKRKKPRLPQLPPSIAEGALLPPVK